MSFHQHHHQQPSFHHQCIHLVSSQLLPHHRSLLMKVCHLTLACQFLTASIDSHSILFCACRDARAPKDKTDQCHQPLCCLPCYIPNEPKDYYWAHNAPAFGTRVVGDRDLSMRDFCAAALASSRLDSVFSCDWLGDFDRNIRDFCAAARASSRSVVGLD